MRSLLTILLFSFLFDSGSKSREQFNFVDVEDYRMIENVAFKAGEKASYLVHYGIIDAGTAHLEINEADRKINGRSLYQIIGTGKSEGIVNFFFKVDDKYETFVDREGIFPWLFIRDINEGGYKVKQTYKFYQNKNKVETQKGNTHDVPAAVQDMFSAAFYARTLDLQKLEVGDIVTVKSFVDDENFDLMIRYGGKADVKIKSGIYRCLKFNPVIQEGRIFNTAQDLEVWISDDENKLPILCKAKILIGAVKVEIIDYEGLSNPLAIKKKK